MPTGENKQLIVATPRGAIYRTNGGDVRLVWNENFGPRMTKAFQTAQSMFDQECLRLCSKYVPFDTGLLDKSGILHSVIGSGELRWETPYARKVYYTNLRFSPKHHPLAGSHWGQRMKADNLQHLQNFVRKAVSQFAK